MGGKMPPTIKASGDSDWALGGNGRGNKFIAYFEKEVNRLPSAGFKVGLKENINKTESYSKVWGMGMRDTDEVGMGPGLRTTCVSTGHST